MAHTPPGLDLDLKDSEKEGGDEHERIFDSEVLREKLRKRKSQPSPRRQSDMSSDFHETSTLPFYQDISPSTALQNLFDWFSSTASNPAASEGGSEHDSSKSKKVITRDDFNRLRKCTGKRVVDEREWALALEELGVDSPDKSVSDQHFKALFGPPPFFGSSDVQKIVHKVMKAEEFLHFADILVSRFGVESASLSSDSKKVIGLEQLQDIQRASSADSVFERSDWLELCAKLGLSKTTEFLTWLQFSEAFSVSVNGKRICEPHKDPAAAVYAVLASDKVMETIKDAGDDQVSQKAFTNLLRVQRENVDDDVWLNLLQNMQTTYKYRQQKHRRKSSFAEARQDDAESGHGYEQPLVVVRNTRNQVLSYEIMFDELGDIGLELQSDFLGQCVTVAKTVDQAARHSIIHQHDIVAAVNGTNLMYDTMALDSAKEKERLERAKQLLNANAVRKVTFLRQESYYQYNAEKKFIYLYLKTINRVPQDGIIHIHLPAESSWKPVTYYAVSDMSSLEVEFEIPKHPDFEQARISWKEDARVIEIVLDGETAIGENSTLVLKVSGIDCGNQIALGPCELTAGEETVSEAEDQAPVCVVSLCSNWHTREGALGNPIRDRVRRAGEYFDSSLKPLGKDFISGDSGLTLESDFFGQCPVVTTVRRSSPGEKLDVRKHDILTSITSIGGDDGKTLNQLNCIKPFALSKRDADTHIKEVRKQLAACYTSGRPYHLEFLRLNSYFFHENGRTIFTFHALTSLREKTSLLIKLPSTKWHVSGLLTASVMDPPGVKVGEVVWDSQQYAVHLALENCLIPESAVVVVEISGVEPPAKTKGVSGSSKGTRCAGPGEIVGVYSGSDESDGNAPEMEFILHEHWHSFIVGHQGIEAAKINETLKKFKTTPAKLWEVLEYTSLLFELCKSPDAETLSFSDMNKLIGLVCGEGEVMDLPKWNKLCRELGATPLIGLSRRQFACCWNDVTGLSKNSAKDVYLNIQTAKKLFAEITSIFQADEESHLITKETISKLASIAGFSKEKALKFLEGEDRLGWESDLFCQIVCGGNRDFQLEDNGLNLWIKIFYAKKLFNKFKDSNPKHKTSQHTENIGLPDGFMKKKNFIELFKTAKITKPKLTNDVWTKVCDSVGLDETSGFSFDKFLEVYSREPLGPRDPLADYYRIETFEILPERQAKIQEASKEAALSVAPEKIDVKEVAKKALDDVASAEEVFEDLVKQGLEFKKLDKIEEKDETKTFKFKCKYYGKQRSRSTGFFHLKIGGISELTDHVVATDREFNKENKLEELYVMFEITDEQGVRDRMPQLKKKGWCTMASETLFGVKENEGVYVVQKDEMWDDGVTQGLMREMHEAETHLGACNSGTPEYDAALAKLSMLMSQLTPKETDSAETGAFNGRVFSSKVVRDSSPDAIVQFPDDHFRLFFDRGKGNSRKLLVCKLFKCIGSEVRKCELDRDCALEAEASANKTYEILKNLVEQQKLHLQYVVANKYKSGIKSENDKYIWSAVSKLRQKQEDLKEFKVEVDKRTEAVTAALKKLEDAKEKEKIELADNHAQSHLSVPGYDSDKPGETVVLNAPDVRLIGQAFFDVGDLLDVLDEDEANTDDVTHFRAVNSKDTGVLLLHFEYKCENLQHETPRYKPKAVPIAMSGNDESTVVEKIKEEEAFEYPSHSYLEVQWTLDGPKNKDLENKDLENKDLENKDQLYLVREGERSKLSQPYFVLAWISSGSGNESDEQCDWTIPNVLRKLYPDPKEIYIWTSDSKKEGMFHLPSSTRLSLPPGLYKLYLIRNDLKNNTRSVLARTPTLVVLPDRSNSVHTAFGTTPLIDVKPVYVTLQVFSEEDRWVVEDALENQDGFYDQDYLDQIESEQEIEVAKREIEETEVLLEKTKHKKKENEQARKKIEKLKVTLERLEDEKKRLEAMQHTRRNAGNATRVRPSKGGAMVSAGQELVISYRFNRGKPSPHDQIEILPADVVLVSDNLRSLILGKLQGNKAEQVERIRKTMEAELIEVAHFFSLNYVAKVWKLVLKKLCGNKNNGFSVANGESDNSFVWHECMKAFKTAPPTAKRNFAFVILDLLDEIAARKSHLKLEGVVALSDAERAKFNSFLKVGLRIPVLAADKEEGQIGHWKELANGVAVGECKTLLKGTFRQGGHYIAKYVRRTDAKVSSESLVEDAGEVCRFGPFYVEPATFSFSPSQLYLNLLKLLIKCIQSEQFKLAYKSLGHAAVSLLKYFLAVVNLSFNVSVLAGNFNFKDDRLQEIIDNFKAQLLYYYGPIQKALAVIYSFFSGYIEELMDKLVLFDVNDQCVTGFLLYRAFVLLFAATFVVYVVVQEDLLLKIQKLHTYLPMNPGKSLLGFLEQIGALLVIPLYLAIKSCVLFISEAWHDFYDRINSNAGLAKFKLYQPADSACRSATLAKLNYGFGIAALVLIVIFLFVCLPLLLLDLYSWVPLTELEKQEKLRELAHSFDRDSIKAAVHSNANLVECEKPCGCCARGPRLRCCCKLPKRLQFQGFQVYYDDYTQLPSLELLRKYGILGLMSMFTYVYMILMLQSMARSLGVLLAWRPRASHMYKSTSAQPVSTWKFYDRFCLRFNIAWKVQYIKDKIVMPFVNIVLVTLGLWGEEQWKEFNVEERANLCYLMEPSAEIKQLQMMSLHGKITSLFWLCIPKTMLLAYLAEVLNRGPVLSYFLNKKFLQADIPESERESDPVWRFFAFFGFEGEEDVVYLTETRFYSTTVKWGSSLVEIITLLLVFPSAKEFQSQLLGTALISAAVTPILEFNQQVIKAYVEYKESVEHLISKNDMLAKLSKTRDRATKAHEIIKKVQSAAGGISLNPMAKGVNDRSKSAKKMRNGRPDTEASKPESTTTNERVVGAGASTRMSGIQGDEEKDNDDASGGIDGFANSDEIAIKIAEKAEELAEGAEDIIGEEGAAAMYAAAGMIKPKRERITLNALPEISYVVLTDDLDEGEGEITVNWQINAKQRFHALDAIGMFAAGEAGVLKKKRTMKDCICYCLLKQRSVEPFGWKPNRQKTEDLENKMLFRQATALRNVTESDIRTIKSNNFNPEVERSEAHAKMLKSAENKIQTMMSSPRLKPYPKKMSDMLEEEVVEKKLHNVSRKSTRILSNVALNAEEAAKKARKVIAGQVKFRPANSNAKEESHLETFVFGNNAGIYQSKYGLQKYNFCYLRHADVEARQVGLSEDKAKAAADAKLSPAEEQPEDYEILDRFSSNEISIGTFNLFMTLTCDVPLVGANETVNLSWMIYGVPYSILSNVKSRNCVAFYKVEGCGGCSKIEIIPTSAYLEVQDHEPCPGRMLAVAPKEPGIYEIRFLFNFFREAQLHRQCQVFGDLEDQMYQLRIRSFYEKRTLVDEMQRFSTGEPKLWGIARMNTYVWLKSMLLSTIREPVEESVVESTSEYSAFLYGRLHSKLTRGMKTNSKVYQERIRNMVAPLNCKGFMNVLEAALSTSSQMNDLLASIVFISPTDEDIKNIGRDPFRDSLLLPKDSELLKIGPSGFRLMTKNYLSKRSLCGYHDFVDDIVLNHVQIQHTVDQVMKNLASTCVTLYESSIKKAADALMKEAKILNKENAIQGIDATLVDLCRNHIQSIVRALVATDCRTGMRWKGPSAGTSERLAALRRGSFRTIATIEADISGSHGDGNSAPVTLEHLAVRRWIRPHLERKILSILRQRHARLLQDNIQIMLDLLPICCGPNLSLVGNPFPSYQASSAKSVLYFLEEGRGNEQQSNVGPGN